MERVCKIRSAEPPPCCFLVELFCLPADLSLISWSSQTKLNSKLLSPAAAVAGKEAEEDMSDDNEDIQLPIPSRTTGAYPGGVGSLRSGRGGIAGAGGGAGGTGGGATGGGGTGGGERRSSRKIVVEGFRSASARRLNLSSFATSNGSSKGLNGSTDVSTTGGFGAVRGGVGKSCTACGIQFTWRMRRHHCRACRQVTYCCSVDVACSWLVRTTSTPVLRVNFLVQAVLLAQGRKLLSFI